MLVRSLCNHFNGTYRKEGEKFDYSGPLYEHIEPVKEKPKGRNHKPVENDDDEEA